MVPVTTDQFFGVFVAYNTETSAALAGLIAVALVAAFGAMKGGAVGRRVAMGSLAILWLWTGIVFHLVFFAKVNPAAYAFGVLFVVQAALFGREAVRAAPHVEPARNRAGLAGVVLVVYALLIYPAIGALTGHSYPAAPMFGAPCPVTIFTFGVLLLMESEIRVRLLVVPLIWGLAGATAVWVYGVVADAALPVAALFGLALILWRNRRLRESAPLMPMAA